MERFCNSTLKSAVPFDTCVPDGWVGVPVEEACCGGMAESGAHTGV